MTQLKPVALPQKYYLEAELEDRITSDTTIWEFLRKSSLDGMWYWDLENPENEWMSPEFWELLGFLSKLRTH